MLISVQNLGLMKSQFTNNFIVSQIDKRMSESPFDGWYIWCCCSWPSPVSWSQCTFSIIASTAWKFLGFPNKFHNTCSRGNYPVKASKYTCSEALSGKPRNPLEALNHYCGKKNDEILNFLPLILRSKLHFYYKEARVSWNGYFYIEWFFFLKY